eukprot:178963-Chlamydomonas_euryale.AAC.1
MNPDTGWGAYIVTAIWPQATPRAQLRSTLVSGAAQGLFAASRLKMRLRCSGFRSVLLRRLGGWRTVTS